MDNEAPQPGMYWHSQHDLLVHWCPDPKQQADFIRECTMREEHPLRFRLFKPVRGQLPAELVESAKAFVATYAPAHKANWDFMRALAASDSRQADPELEEAHREARRIYDEAWRIAREAEGAYRKVIEAYRKEIEDLHAIECPDCPWNGKTIFPKEATRAEMAV